MPTNYCPTHWGSREPQNIRPEVAAPAEDATCDVCGKPASRASEAVEPEATPRGQLEDSARTEVTQDEPGKYTVTVKRPSKRP